RPRRRPPRGGHGRLGRAGRRVRPAVAAPRWLPAAFLVLAALCLAGCRDDHQTGPADRASVVRIVDGDTLVLDIGGEEELVRLLGIDTPETVHPDEPVGCYGPEASAALAQLLPVGTQVSIARDEQPRDQYG